MKIIHSINTIVSLCCLYLLASCGAFRVQNSNKVNTWQSAFFLFNSSDASIEIYLNISPFSTKSIALDMHGVHLNRLQFRLKINPNKCYCTELRLHLCTKCVFLTPFCRKLFDWISMRNQRTMRHHIMPTRVHLGEQMFSMIEEFPSIIVWEWNEKSDDCSDGCDKLKKWANNGIAIRRAMNECFVRSGSHHLKYNNTAATSCTQSQAAQILQAPFIHHNWTMSMLLEVNAI